MYCIKISSKISKAGKQVFQDKCTQRTVLGNEEFWDFVFRHGEIVSSGCKCTLETLLFLCTGETMEKDGSHGLFDHRSSKAAYKLYSGGWVELPQQERVTFEQKVIGISLLVRRISDCNSIGGDSWRKRSKQGSYPFTSQSLRLEFLKLENFNCEAPSRNTGERIKAGSHFEFCLGRTVKFSSFSNRVWLTTEEEKKRQSVQSSKQGFSLQCCTMIGSRMQAQSLVLYKARTMHSNPIEVSDHTVHITQYMFSNSVSSLEHFNYFPRCKDVQNELLIYF